MFYPDLSVYDFFESDMKPSLLNIGWLDKDHKYNKGNVSSEILEKILYLCVMEQVNVTRGRHICQFCRIKTPDIAVRFSDIAVRFNGKKEILGSSEIRVKGVGDIEYAAPNLIYHYIAKHNYLPPKEFLDGVNRIKVDRCKGSLYRIRKLLFKQFRRSG